MNKKIKKKAPKRDQTKTIADAYKGISDLQQQIIESIEMDSADLINDSWWQAEEELTEVVLTPEVLRARRLMLLDKIRGSQWLLNDINELVSALYQGMASGLRIKIHLSAAGLSAVPQPSHFLASTDNATGGKVKVKV